LNQYTVKVARVRNPEFLEQNALFSGELLGIDHIINPESVMVETIRNLMMFPEASDVIDFVDGRVKLIGVTIRPDSPFVGRQLLSFKGMEGKLLVGAIVRGEQVIIPRGEDTLQANDLAYVVVRTDELRSVFNLLNIKDEELRRVIIVGAGQTGSALATALDQTKINVKILDKDSQRCTSLAEKLERVMRFHGCHHRRRRKQCSHLAPSKRTGGQKNHNPY
jgi:trk system potassium uptake protein TrkA